MFANLPTQDPSKEGHFRGGIPRGSEWCQSTLRSSVDSVIVAASRSSSSAEGAVGGTGLLLADDVVERSLVPERGLLDVPDASSEVLRRAIPSPSAEAVDGLLARLERALNARRVTRGGEGR